MAGTNTKLKRSAKREAAEKRKAEYDKLTPAQKIARLDELGFTARRQREKLNGAG